jgi:hypothetical protein
MTNSRETSTARASGDSSLKVAILTDRPAELPNLLAGLRSYAPRESLDIRVWVSAERFRAPSGTQLPYRSMARLEAQHITAERVAVAAAEAQESLPQWPGESPLEVEIVLDVTGPELTSRLALQDVHLLVCQAESRLAGIGAQAALEAACSLLLLPVPGLHHRPSHSGWRWAGGLLRVHG